MMTDAAIREQIERMGELGALGNSHPGIRFALMFVRLDIVT